MSPEKDDQAGRAIGNRYDVVKQIARGGMGRVLLAKDRHLEREVAIKTLLAEDAGKTSQDRLVEEAQIGGQLVHPNILTVHELGREKDELFVVMKLVRGRDLKALIDELAENKGDTATRYGLRRLLRLFLKACEGMAYAHERGVIHRDLKPANVMLDDRDEVLVMDWGLAKPLAANPQGGTAKPGKHGSFGSNVLSSARELSSDGQLTQQGAILGTPVYMPLEQADASHVLDARADVYSLGAILYHLVTRKAPYSGSAVVVIQSLFKAAPVAPRLAAPALEIPAAVESIIVKAMARDREHRYPDAGALAADVAAFLDGRVPAAHAETLREQIARTVRRHSVAIGTAAATITLLLGLGLVARSAMLGEQAAAEAQVAEAVTAEAAAEQERELARTAELGASAARAAALAVQRAAAFANESRRGIPVGEIASQHASIRALVGDARARVQALAGGASGQAAATLGPALDRALANADLALAEALVARAPGLALERLPALTLGAAGPLLRARAQDRDGRAGEAAKTLAETSFPREREDLATAARALAARLAAADDEVARWDQACDKNPRAGWVYLARAEAQLAKGAFDAADRDLERAARLAPTDAWVALTRIEKFMPPGRDYVVSEGTADLAKILSPELERAWMLHETPKVWRGLDGAGNFAPNPTTADLERLAAEHHAKPLESALYVCERARLAGKHELCEAWARIALARSPEDAGALGYLAEALLRQRRLDEATDAAERALRVAPRDPRASFVRGEAARLKGDLSAKTVADLEAGVRGSLEPEHWERLARVLAESSTPADWVRGVEAARRAIALDQLGEMHGNGLPMLPGDGVLHRTLGKLRSKQGDHALAALHFAHAVALAPVTGAGLEDAIYAGDEHRALGLEDEARQLYEMASRDPRARALAQERLGKR